MKIILRFDPNILVVRAAFIEECVLVEADKFIAAAIFLYTDSIIRGTISMISGLKILIFLTICISESLMHMHAPKEKPFIQSITRQYA